LLALALFVVAAFFKATVAALHTFLLAAEIVRFLAAHRFIVSRITSGCMLTTLLTHSSASTLALTLIPISIVCHINPPLNIDH
jgi:hypothetical protein